MSYLLLFIIFIGIEISNQMLIGEEPATSSVSKYTINTLKNEKKEIVTVAVDFSEIGRKILGKNGDIERQLEKCQKVGAAIAWSILWELELLKKENASDILLEEEDKTENSKNFKKIKESVGKLFFETQRTKNFKSCQSVLKRNLQNLEDDKNDFGESKNIHDIIHLAELDDFKKGNLEKRKMDKFIEGFLLKNRIELELAEEFVEFNKILGTDLAKKGGKDFFLIVSKELVEVISEVHQLIVKLNEQNDIRKKGKIANDLAEKIKALNEEWEKFVKVENLTEFFGLKRTVDNKINIISSHSNELCRDIESWEKYTGISKKFFENGINYFGPLLEYWINFISWSVMPEETDVDMPRIAVQQLIVKLALFRRFILNEFSQKNAEKIKNDDNRKKEYDVMKQNKLKEKLKQKIKWILRRKQRLEDQMQNEQKENFRLKFTKILGKIGEELKKFFPAAWIDHSFKQPLRRYYYGNEDKQTLKIRVNVREGEDATLSKKWIDKKLDKNNERKAKPIEGAKKFSVVEADAIFFDMPAKGWIPKNFDLEGMRYCATYSYEFVFHLINGDPEICSAKEKWPQPYLDQDTKAVTHENLSRFNMVSIFSKEYANNYRNKLNAQKRDEDTECGIKELEIQILMIKGEKWHLMEKQKGKKEVEVEEAENAESNKQMLQPAIVAYDTGRFYRHRNYTTKALNCPFDFLEPLNIQEHLVKEAETNEAILYSALIKVNVCNVDGVPRAFVNNLILSDSKMEYLIHAFGGANLYEENGGGHHLFKFEFGETIWKMNESIKSCDIYDLGV